VQKPLSIQAHPNRSQAEEGFLRENEAGIAADAPQRNYKDINHKPEILCALSQFTVMAGFRKSENIFLSFKTLQSFAPRRMRGIFSLLLRDLETASLYDFFRDLYKMPRSEIECLCALTEKHLSEGGGSGISREQLAYMKKFAALYPHDAGVLSPLYLNLFTLKPFQAIFIPSGILHSYISGFAVELMANSDNVLRGGLTPKHVDVRELLKILDFTPFMPQIFSPSSPEPFRYPVPFEDFSLSLIRGTGGEIAFNEKLPAIFIVTEGELNVCGEVFKKGESFFAPFAGDSAFTFKGNYSLFAAAGNSTLGAVE